MIDRDLSIKNFRDQRARLAEKSRKDFATFCQFVMRDEETRKPIVLADHHHEWIRIMDDEDLDRIVLWSAPELGKTALWAVARTLWELGNDPSLRFVLLGNTQKAGANKLAGVIKQYIEESAELRAVFPDMRPGTPWNSDVFNVSNAPRRKDYSVQCAAPHGNVQGSRIDRLVADDILDWENTLTQRARQDLVAWWPVITNRLTARARVRFLTNAWHPQDLAHELAKKEDWVSFKYPIHRDGESIWPERWPWERIEQRARELGPSEAQRVLMCVARAEGIAHFPPNGIELALRLGDGTELAQALVTVPRGYRTFTGVDLAVKQTEKNDTTCMLTIAVDMRTTQRSIIGIDRGRWPGPEIVRRIIDVHRRFQSVVWVEDNAAQDYLRQWVNEREPIPIKGFTTGRNKSHPEYGIPGIATEMERGLWRIPNSGGRVHPEIQKLIDEATYYSPEVHTGDALMALYFAREAARQAGIRVGNMGSLNMRRR